MSYAASEIQEVRFIIEPELTQCYVFVKAIGDCPLGVQGCHHKTFPKSESIQSIVNSKEFLNYLLWPLAAPPADE